MNSGPEGVFAGSQPLEARECWIEDELAGCEFHDVRHGKRLNRLLERISFGQGSSMPWALQDWANTKAAYRFFANGRVDEATILEGISRPLGRDSNQYEMLVQSWFGNIYKGFGTLRNFRG
jgi:hypothetical protein